VSALAFLSPGPGALAKSPMEPGAAAAGATFEERDGWQVAVAFPNEDHSVVGFADMSHLGKIEVQGDVSPGQVGTTLVGRPDASLNTGSTSGDGAVGGDSGSDPNSADRLSRLEDKLNQDEGSGGFSGETVVAAVRAIDPRPALVFLGLLLALLALAVARFNWRFRRYGPIESAWGKTRLLASYVGYPAHPSQTTYEFASSLGAAIPETHDPVQSLARARVLEQYSAEGADEDLRDAAETAWHQVASTMLTLLPGRILRFITHLWR